MTTPAPTYKAFRIETADHGKGEVEIYAGVIVEVSAAPAYLPSLVPLLGRPWADVSPSLVRVEASA